MKDVLDIHRALLGRAVPHEVVRLARAVASADEIPDVTGLPAQRCVAVRLYLADDRLVAVAVPAGSTPRAGAVLDAARAATLAAAPAALVNRVTDYAVALAAPLLMPAEVTVLVDAALLRHEVVYIPTGDSGTVIGIRSDTLAAEAGAQVVDTTAQPDALAVDLSAEPAATAAYPTDLTLAGLPVPLRR